MTPNHLIRDSIVQRININKSADVGFIKSSTKSGLIIRELSKQCYWLVCSFSYVATNFLENEYKHDVLKHLCIFYTPNFAHYVFKKNVLCTNVLI